jgi:hypothetical protein
VIYGAVCGGGCRSPSRWVVSARARLNAGLTLAASPNEAMPSSPISRAVIGVDHHAGPIPAGPQGLSNQTRSRLSPAAMIRAEPSGRLRRQMTGSAPSRSFGLSERLREACQRLRHEMYENWLEPPAVSTWTRKSFVVRRAVMGKGTTSADRHRSGRSMSTELGRGRYGGRLARGVSTRLRRIISGPAAGRGAGRRARRDRRAMPARKAARGAAAA